MLPERVPEALTFDDVLLRPAYTEVAPGEVTTRVALTPRLELGSPFVGAAMDTVGEARLAIALARRGGLGTIHRNLDVAAQAAEVRAVKAETDGRAVDARGRLACAAAVGVGEDARARAEALIEAGVDALVVDTAHGHAERVLDAVRGLRRDAPTVPLIAGNVADAAGTRALAEAGADVVKAGVGPGSICTTRRVAGVGVPQLTAVAEAAVAAEETGVALVADGGIRRGGDVVKALAAGAHAVMLGSLLAGTDEAPGERVVDADGRAWKRYRGMGSHGAMQRGAHDRYGHGAADRKVAAEGVEARVPGRGPLAGVVDELDGALRAGMGYVGAADVPALRRYDGFVRITAAGLAESGVHGVVRDEPGAPE